MTTLNSEHPTHVSQIQATSKNNSTVISIDSTQLHTWLQTGEAVLVDVREPAEFSEWHIPQAVSIPLTNIEKHILCLQSEQRKIVFQCLKGTRGNMAANKAFDMLPNHNEVYNLTGGITAWKQAGFSIIEEKEQTGLPIMRQVMISAGLLILIGSALALFGLSFGTYLTAFVGAGLLFSGVSGFCGMAIILGKMPWNN